MKVSENLQRIAGKVMERALPIQKGQTVTLMAGGHNLDLAYAFAAECAIRDIEALVVSSPDYVAEARLRKAPISSFQRMPKLTPKLVELSDWLILMTGSRHDGSIWSDPGLADRLIEIQRTSVWSIDHLLQLCLEMETCLVAFLDPNLQQAETLGLSFEETKERFLESLDIDYEALSDLGERIISAMDGAKEIHLTSPKGTDLTVHPGQRPWVNDDGRPDRVPGVTPFIRNLPVGEVFVAPLEDSATGVFLPEDFPGSPMRDVRIEFNAGALAQISARKGAEFLNARLAKATGNPYCIAEFAIGTNPCGDPLLATEKAFGTVHVAVGQNTWLGGNNECSLHMDMLVDKPTVTVDGECILEDGEFNI